MTTATDGAAILKAILDDPADDLPRLAYADWLGDSSNEAERDRGAFIRDQALWLPGSDDIDLLDRHLEAWCPWFARHDEFGFSRELDGSLKVTHARGERTHWVKGFIKRVSCPLQAWLDHGPALVRAHPIRKMTLTDVHVIGPIEHGPSAGRWMTCRRDVGNELWPLLAGAKEVFATFTTREAGECALSVAALAWANAGRD